MNPHTARDLVVLHLRIAYTILRDHHDVEDGERPRPNWAMRATQAIDELIAELEQKP